MIEFEDKTTSKCSLYNILDNKVLYEDLTKLVGAKQYALYRKDDGKIIMASLYGLVEMEYTDYRTYGGLCYKLYTDDEKTFELFNIQGKSLGKFEDTTIQVISRDIGFAVKGILLLELKKV